MGIFNWVKKLFYDKQENDTPKFIATITMMETGESKVDIDFNAAAIVIIDHLYNNNTSTDYNLALSSDAKASIYLADIIIGIANQYLPPPPEETGDNIPLMAVRGGKENKQVFDISQKDKNFGGYDIERG